MMAKNRILLQFKYVLQHTSTQTLVEGDQLDLIMSSVNAELSIHSVVQIDISLHRFGKCEIAPALLHDAPSSEAVAILPDANHCINRQNCAGEYKITVPRHRESVLAPRAAMQRILEYTSVSGVWNI